MKKILLIFISIVLFSCSSDSDNDTDNTNSCAKPTNLYLTTIANTFAQLDWTSQVNSSLYQVEYGNLGFTLGSGTLYTVPDTYKIIEGLEPETQYSFYTRVYCNDIEAYSNWAGPFSFVTTDDNPYCNEPTNFSLGYNTNGPNVGSDYARFLWSDNGGDEYEIEYGDQGFNPGNGTVHVTSENSSTTVSGLTAQTTYDFYIKSKCTENGYSVWTGPLTVTTTTAAFNPNCIDPFNFENIGTGTGSSSGFPTRYFDFNWDHVDSQNNWEITYVEAGTSFNTLNTAAIPIVPVRLTYFVGSSGLTSGQAYDYYIRSNCGGTNGFSDWIGPVTVTVP
ncbi:fibronectin type III domain-containing protein [Olleya sp. Ti.3.14]|uniref:fibronectin type III domain-containing protein n=1 Tax=Olleya sp. Ti.3.14 TaxID=3121297 RepID=UPI00311FA42D